MKTKAAALMSTLVLATLGTATDTLAATCSELKAQCDRGVASRGQTDISQCPEAFRACMRTGVWETTGQRGRRITGVTRQ